MSKKDLSNRDQYQMDENAFMKLGDKFKAYKHIVEVETPNARNTEAAGKFALRFVDYWERWEQSATKPAVETKDPEVWRKVENYKQQVEKFAEKATKLANDFKMKRQFEEMKKHSLGKMMDVDHTKSVAEPSRNAALFKPCMLLKDATITEFKQWQQCYRAYFEQSKMATGNANLQRSSLDTCIDDNLVAIVERESDSKNPMTYSIGDRLSTMEKHFDSLHPIHVRHP